MIITHKDVVGFRWFNNMWLMVVETERTVLNVTDTAYEYIDPAGDVQGVTTLPVVTVTIENTPEIVADLFQAFFVKKLIVAIKVLMLELEEAELHVNDDGEEYSSYKAVKEALAKVNL
jgi:hypothetical protein